MSRGQFFFFLKPSFSVKSLDIPVWEGGDGASDRNSLKITFLVTVGMGREKPPG